MTDVKIRCLRCGRIIDEDSVVVANIIYYSNVVEGISGCVAGCRVCLKE